MPTVAESGSAHIPVRDSPYVGPRPFQRSEAHMFFGREREAAELASLVRNEGVVVLQGDSGVGKSSLVNTRLLLTLEHSGFDVLPVARLGLPPPPASGQAPSPNPYTVSALISWLGPDELVALRIHSIAEYLEERRRNLGPSDRPMPRVLVFDQCEELTAGDGDSDGAARAFFDDLQNALSHDPSLRVLAVIEGSALAGLDSYAGLVPGGLRVRYRLGRLRRGAAYAAITRPLDAVCRRFADGAPDRLVDSLARVKLRSANGRSEAVGEFVDPLHLQVACLRAWEAMCRNGSGLKPSEIPEVGDLEQDLQEFCHGAIREAASASATSETQLREWLERNLLKPSGRAAGVWGSGPESAQITSRALEALRTSGILWSSTYGIRRYHTLAHERLATALAPCARSRPGAPALPPALRNVPLRAPEPATPPIPALAAIAEPCAEPAPIAHQATEAGVPPESASANSGGSAAMGEVGRLIHRLPVWVSPDHTIEAAAVLIRRSGLTALPVLDGGEPVGLLRPADLLLKDPRSLVGGVMARDLTTVAASASVREALEAFRRDGANPLVVVDGQRFLGLLGPDDLLPALDGCQDPLCGLPTANRMQIWAAGQLEAGREIGILHFDVVRLARMNKRLGYEAGDQVLATIARVIRDHVDPEKDFPCRCSGDEFCVATCRDSDDAPSLGARIAASIQAESQSGQAMGEVVQLAVGSAGGRRKVPREDVHLAATVNSLMLLAARDCAARKPATHDEGNGAGIPDSAEPYPPAPDASGADTRPGGEETGPVTARAISSRTRKRRQTA